MTRVQAKFLTVLLLMFLMSVPANGEMLFVKNYSNEISQESLPEEVLQEKQLAVRVIRRLKITDDFGPLLRGFFIKDLLVHARLVLKDKVLFNQEDENIGIEQRVLTRATDDDLRRAYVAVMNAWNLFNQLGDATDRYVAARNNVEGGDIFDPKYRKLRGTAREEALTHAFFVTANTNPLMSLLVQNLISGVASSDEAAYNAKLKAATIRSVKAFRAFINTLMKCVDLMRYAVRKLRADRDKLNVGRVIEARGDDESEHIYKYWTDTLEKSIYGFKAGTKLIYARIYPWEIVMIRRKGKLKVVVVYPDFDGD